jgi:hypothetical protein
MSNARSQLAGARRHSKKVLSPLTTRRERPDVDSDDLIFGAAGYCPDRATGQTSRIRQAKTFSRFPRGGGGRAYSLDRRCVRGRGLRCQPAGGGRRTVARARQAENLAAKVTAKATVFEALARGSGTRTCRRAIHPDLRSGRIVRRLAGDRRCRRHGGHSNEHKHSYQHPRHFDSPYAQYQARQNLSRRIALLRHFDTHLPQAERNFERRVLGVQVLIMVEAEIKKHLEDSILPLFQ